MSVRIGVVGAGVQGRLHARTLCDIDGAELMGVADTAPAGRKWVEQELKKPAYSSLEELLPDIDAAVICLPDHLHEEPTIAALQAGKRVLLEKPMALSSAACDRIIAHLPDPDALMIGQTLRFDPRVVRAKEAIDRGDIGAIWDVRVWRCTSQAVGEGVWGRTSVAWFLGIHDVDLVRFLTSSDLTTLSAYGRRRLSSNWDSVHAMLETSSGALVQMTQNWLLPHSRPSRADAGFKIIGEDGVIEGDLSHNDLLVARRGGEAAYVDTRFWPSAAMSGGAWNLKTELDAFVRSAAVGGPTPVSAAEGRAAVEAVEQVERLLSHET